MLWTLIIKTQNFKKKAIYTVHVLHMVPRIHNYRVYGQMAKIKKSMEVFDGNHGMVSNALELKKTQPHLLIIINFLKSIYKYNFC